MRLNLVYVFNPYEKTGHVVRLPEVLARVVCLIARDYGVIWDYAENEEGI